MSSGAKWPSALNRFCLSRQLRPLFQSYKVDRMGIGKMKEKLDAMRKAFVKAGVSVRDFEIAARIHGLSNNDYGIWIFDLAKMEHLTDDDLPELIRSEVKNTLEKEAMEREIYLAKSGLHERQKRVIKARPLDAWRGVSRGKKKDIAFRLINHDVINKYFSRNEDDVEANGVRMTVGGDDLRFFDIIIYSALMTLFDKQEGFIAYRGLLEFLDPACQWRRGDHCDWIEAVKESIDRLTMTGISIGDDASSMIDAVAGDDGIAIKGSAFWRKANEQSRVFPVPSAYMKSGKCRIDWLSRMYVARKVLLSSDCRNKMKAELDIIAMGKAVGHIVSANVIAGYLNYLAKSGVLSDVRVTGSTISWTPVFKASKRAENSVTSVVKTTVKGDDGKPMKDAQGRKIKQVIDVPKTAEAKRRDDAVAAYNEYIERQDITLDGRKLDCSVKAEYTDDYEHAGRLYTKATGHQIKGRENIRINGEKTVEVDFATYHTQMIYDMEGIALTGDAYDFLANRDHAKRTLNILFNASTEKEAKGAIHAACCVSYDDAEKYIDLAKKRHQAIASHFGKGEGLTLQNKDAAIMLDILARLMAKRIPALPVHDSVIVPINAEAKAIEAMMDAYKEAVGGDARIKSEGVEMRKYDATELRAYK